MSFSPDTLEMESAAEKKEREARTGVFGNGVMVECRPNLEDPMVVQTQHRAACLTKPHQACTVCPHSTFTLAFNTTAKSNRYRMVSCPRWASEQDRLNGQDPDHYVPTEEATCLVKPFSFCPSCPSFDEAKQEGIDKTKDGWFGRWDRLGADDDQ